ncbi:hypothetical protein RJ641_034601 [Dillenia turbinata]|uniref:Uncharacterized protein n=1 Tax=Dillenia turbinata TaxID=194707 RepID=A0AAN8VQX9_9MAGN
MTPKILFLKQRTKNKSDNEGSFHLNQENDTMEEFLHIPREEPALAKSIVEEEEGLLLPKESQEEGKINATEIEAVLLLFFNSHKSATRVLKKKKKKLNFNPHRPAGTRVVFGDEGNSLPPLTTIADTKGGNGTLELDKGGFAFVVTFDQRRAQVVGMSYRKISLNARRVDGSFMFLTSVNERYAKLRQEMKERDKEDKLLQRQRQREKRKKEKMKYKVARPDDEEEEDLSGSDEETTLEKTSKRSKIYADSDNDEEQGKKNKENLGFNADSISD